MEVMLAVFVLPSTCPSLVLFLDVSRWSFFTDITASPGSSPVLHSWQPRGNVRWHRRGQVERKWGKKTHKVNDQCKKDTICSQGKQMDHAGDLPHEKSSIHTEELPHNQSRRQELFSMSLFYPADSFSLFYQGCDSKESKNQQLKLGVIYCILHSLNSFSLSLHMTTLQPKTSLSYSLCFWFLLRCHVYCCWCRIFFSLSFGETKTVYLLKKVC